MYLELGSQRGWAGGFKTLTRDRRILAGEFLRMRWLRRCAGFLLGIMHAGYCARMPTKRCSKVCAESHGTPDGRKCGLGAPQGLPKTVKLSLRDAKCGQDASKSVFVGEMLETHAIFVANLEAPKTILEALGTLLGASWRDLGRLLGGFWRHMRAGCLGDIL